MERLAEWVGARLAAQLDLDNNRREVVTYGALALLHNGTSLLMTLVLAAFGGVLPETAVALLSAAVLRHATGGAHLSSSFRCAVATALVFAALGMLGRELTAVLLLWPLWVRVGLVLLAAVLGFTVIYRYAPVAAETRPLRPAHRDRLRRLSLRMAPLYIALFLLGAWVGQWWVGPGLLGYLNQVLTLTPGGRSLVSRLDQFLSREGG